MLLSARFLTDVNTVNSFQVVSQAEINAGDAQFLYFQLVDTVLDRADQGFRPAGRRYVPPTGSSLAVTFRNIDDAKVITRTAAQPFAQDGSIWMVQILSSDPLAGTVSIQATLTEPSRTLTFGGGPGLMLRVR